jgi:hypothetical protein
MPAEDTCCSLALLTSWRVEGRRPGCVRGREEGTTVLGRRQVGDIQVRHGGALSCDLVGTLVWDSGSSGLCRAHHPPRWSLLWIEIVNQSHPTGPTPASHSSMTLVKVPCPHS